MSATTRSAPLAQLYDHDHDLWLVLCERSVTNPGTSTAIQALAAALLGNRDLAEAIVRNGIGHYWTHDWPVLTR